MPRILYLDCFSGASGDMILGALLDAGLPFDELQRALGSLATGKPGFSVAADQVVRAGVAATKFRVIENEPGHPDHHDHQHHHPHHHLQDIFAIIERSALSAAGKERAISLFRRLAEAEAAVHRTSVDDVHLHEVGALDSIVDIVGAVFGFEWFGASDIVASPLNVGSGTVTCAHGTLPVPAPATTRLLEGAPVYASGPAMELVTPTGALLVTAYAGRYGAMPPMTIERVGYGAGDRDPGGTPNLLRVFVGEPVGERAGDRVGLLEFEVDDMNPQIFGVLMDQLYAAGALEVLFAPVQMKKNRPGTLVTVVAAPALREPLSLLVFRETTTIGLRYHEVERECLAREIVPVDTPIGTVRFKVARRAGRILNASPEFDDCARLAAAHGRSIKAVQALAIKAYLDGPGGTP
jgi:uncharacterized protein (TIGR00299 family) protein